MNVIDDEMLQGYVLCEWKRQIFICCDFVPRTGGGGRSKIHTITTRTVVSGTIY